MSGRPLTERFEVMRALVTALRAAREVAAIGFGALLAGIVWLVIVEGVLPGPETSDFNHSLGEMIRGETLAEARSDSALGIVGDPLGPLGFYSTVASFGVLLIVQRVLIGPALAKLPLFLRALPLAVIVFLLWGLLFTTLADDRVDLGAGLFGLDEGISTTITYAIAAYVCAVLGTRVIEVVRTADWWRAREGGISGAGMFGVGMREDEDQPGEKANPPAG